MDHHSHSNSSSRSFSIYHQSATSIEGIKASYDDLLEEYAAPHPVNLQRGAFTTPAQIIGADTSLHHQEYPPRALENKSGTRLLWAKILPDSVACRLYVTTVLIQTTVDLAIEGDLLVRLNGSEQSPGSAREKMPVYLSIFALAHVFQFAMAIDAVYARNTLQFIALTVFNILFLVYAIIQIGEIQASSTSASGIIHIPVNVLANIIPVVISVAELAYIGLGWKIYDEFGWKVYKFLGADRRIKRMYASYQIFECLVKFDVFFWVGFSVQFIWLVLQHDDWEYYVTCAALPLSIVLLVEGHLAARHENKWMMFTFMVGCAGALVYFIFKLFKVLKYRGTSEYSDVWKSLTTFSTIAILLLLLTFVFAVIVLRNFGHGLKTCMTKSQFRGRRSSQYQPRGQMSINPHRMSIE
ncbi:hypothetical protein SERLA73DRAFT_173875 [Serpula lacrymans var. lacrymans S7.3]|uniref:Uncharacterized protein n=2 Tax=Serpula lacrymans var. lacrymans TaxID=341189 RepID=F8PHV1_SERL3|nr:uncharacterized protein SERLADRAFT_454794 [Serpula lacrymans var. lacrymans S7.9]EGO04580.1 hypothetical protein SERLA73DRAFT_173875 [Serpula lacrymans var. lacrymans S7.3]EGO30456.1 hypothetical protein SERLADRAFT_454794 [Serpula lacrymans var. lacrymans S7.9]